MTNEQLVQRINLLTRQLVRVRIQLLYEHSGAIRKDALNAIEAVNVEREAVGLPLLTPQELEEWPGELVDDE